jgi:hypothetical protein
VNFSGADNGNTSDWDSGYYKGECGANEFVAGISQTPSGAVNNLLCCPGQVTKQNCASVVFFTADNREQENPPSGDWDEGHFKGECGPGRYVAGVSRGVNALSPIVAGAVHALYCCAP